RGDDEWPAQAGAAGPTPVALIRPLLDLPKSRLIATLRAANMSFADDPSNRDPRFARTRLRAVLPALADEGLDARRLALLARRMRRAGAVIELAVAAAAAALAPGGSWPPRGPIVFDAETFARLPAEVGLRLLGRAVTAAGDEGPVRLGKLESLAESPPAAIAAPLRVPPPPARPPIPLHPPPPAPPHPPPPP